MQKIFTAPTLEPISLDDLKLHCRIDGTDEDEYLEGLIKAARNQVETITARALIQQTWDYFLNGFPSRNYIELPFGNLISVTSVKYKDSAGTETTMTVTTDYIVETNGAQCGRIVLPYGKSWPSFTAYPSNPISIRFVCGYGTTAESVPEPLRFGIKMIAADFYENREKQAIMASGGFIVNQTLDNLLWPYRLWGNW